MLAASRYSSWLGHHQRESELSPGRAEIAFRDVDPSDYAGLFLTGGRAPEYLRYNEHLMAITRYFFAKSKPVACVCHGVEILAAAGVVQGRRVATVAKCQYDAEFSGGIFLNEACVRDGNLVTGRTYRDNPFYMGEFMRMLREGVQA